jgi:hypothetical protein
MYQEMLEAQRKSASSFRNPDTGVGSLACSRLGEVRGVTLRSVALGRNSGILAGRRGTTAISSEVLIT